MLPTLDPGDLVVTRRQARYDVGDVVAFQVPDGIVIHRIIGGSAENGYLMRGDNNSQTDPWRPRADDVLGRMWLRLPGAMALVGQLRRPPVFASFVAALGLFSLWPERPKRGRRRGARSGSGRAPDGDLPIPGSTPQLVAVVVLGAVAGLFAVGAVSSFRLPPKKLESVESLHHEHFGAFQYTVHTRPSSLSPEQTIGPIAAPANGITVTAQAPPVFTQLAQSLDVAFVYSLESPLNRALQGDLGVLLEVGGGDAWSRTIELQPRIPFIGHSASAVVRVDFTQVMSLASTIREETGYDAPFIAASIVPTVHVWGQVGGDDLDEEFAPAFAMKIDRTEIELDEVLMRRDTHRVGGTIERERKMELLGTTMPVMAVRWLSAVGTAICLAAAGGLGASMYFGPGLGEVGRYRLRYGSMIVSVARTSFDEDTRYIDIASMKDLARLAQRDGRAIFSYSPADGLHTYFVPDGDFVYRYLVAPPAAAQQEEE